MTLDETLKLVLPRGCSADWATKACALCMLAHGLEKSKG